MNALLNFFKPPVYHDDDAKTRAAYYLHVVTLAGMFAIGLLWGARVWISKEPFSVVNAIMFGVLLVMVIGFVMGKNGYFEFSGYLLVFAMWASATLLAISGNGSLSTQAARYIVIAALAGLTMGNRAAIGSALVSLLALAGVAYLQSIGAVMMQSEPTTLAFGQAGVPLILSVVLIYLSANSLQRALAKTQEQARVSAEINERLQETEAALEKEVRAKTEALEKATIETRRRSIQFQTMSLLAQKIAQERDLERLLAATTEIIISQFNYHHVAIYLNDEAQEHTIISAASGETGKRLMELGFKLPIDVNSLIGYAIKSGKLQSSAESRERQFESGAETPNARWEYVLPLLTGSEAIGALDVQTNREEPLDQAEIEALVALASQITIAILNARLFTETQTALAESQMLYGAVVKQTWKTSLQVKPNLGYRYAGVKPIPLDKEADTPEIREALDNETIAVTPRSRRAKENAVAVPLKLRDAVIGVLNVNFPLEMEAGEDEKEVILAAAQRVALALENASLLEESQRRARREQTIGEVSSKISSGMEIEAILRTAVEELGSRISSAQISIELGVDENAEEE